MTGRGIVTWQGPRTAGRETLALANWRTAGVLRDQRQRRNGRPSTRLGQMTRKRQRAVTGDGDGAGPCPQGHGARSSRPTAPAAAPCPSRDKAGWGSRASLSPLGLRDPPTGRQKCGGNAPPPPALQRSGGATAFQTTSRASSPVPARPM